MALMTIVAIATLCAWYFIDTDAAFVIMDLSAIAHLLSLLFHSLTWFSNWWDKQKEQ